MRNPGSSKKEVNWSPVFPQDLKLGGKMVALTMFHWQKEIPKAGKAKGCHDGDTS